MPLGVNLPDFPVAKGHCTSSSNPALLVLLACAINSKKNAVRCGNPWRNEGNPVASLNYVVQAVSPVVDKYCFDFL